MESIRIESLKMLVDWSRLGRPLRLIVIIGRSMTRLAFWMANGAEQRLELARIRIGWLAAGERRLQIE